MYITLLPIAFTGVVNAIFCRSSFLDVLHVPIDNGKKLKDGRRLFGANKTWKGFLGSFVICALLNAIWGKICLRFKGMENWNYMYIYFDNTVAYNLFTGFLFGFVYAVLELPNSFIKRRMDISSGKQGKGGFGFLFKIYDQIDSLIGVILVVALYSKMNITTYMLYVAVGGITHVAINTMLFKLKLRNSIL
jgi:hypothetical protein